MMIDFPTFNPRGTRFTDSVGSGGRGEKGKDPMCKYGVIGEYIINSSPTHHPLPFASSSRKKPTSQSIQTNHLHFYPQPPTTTVNMRFSILPIALLATTVVADSASILAAMAKISGDTSKLNATIAKFHGGLIGLGESIPILIQSTTLLHDINQGTKAAGASVELTFDETIQVASATADLVTSVQSSLQTILRTKPRFDRLLVISPIILINLKQQKAATDKFSKAVITKLPEEFRAIAESITAPIDVAFNDAIAKYKKFF
ncbi:hypothetical protein GMDG_03454 [Pseudogymnoascus destructans 20631-21]|uniref:Antigenic cell wall galactomannoprotein n=1 Tax=Pseudogymnoascus destructans (strain ATCC MYA-4855 / 20631-21) TaxID=658429 RepID=L8G9Q9_PSED2|nr:hypothetical protein GMDG_03454 [Pseudogymnoascus destructans 20631-21]